MPPLAAVDRRPRRVRSREAQVVWTQRPAGALMPRHLHDRRADGRGSTVSRAGVGSRDWDGRALPLRRASYGVGGARLRTKHVPWRTSMCGRAAGGLLEGTKRCTRLDEFRNARESMSTDGACSAGQQHAFPLSAD